MIQSYLKMVERRKNFNFSVKKAGLAGTKILTGARNNALGYHALGRPEALQKSHFKVEWCWIFLDIIKNLSIMVSILNSLNFVKNLSQKVYFYEMLGKGFQI